MTVICGSLQSVLGTGLYSMTVICQSLQYDCYMQVFTL